MRNLRGLVVGLLIALYMPTQALAQQQTFKSESDIVAFVSRVMSRVGNGDLAEAYKAMKVYSSLPAEELDAGLANSLAQRADPKFVTRYGRSIGYAHVGKRKLGDSLLRVTYIEKTERQPIVWVFHFYQRNSGAWVLHEMGWSASTAALYVTES